MEEIGAFWGEPRLHDVDCRFVIDSPRPASQFHIFEVVVGAVCMCVLYLAHKIQESDKTISKGLEQNTS